jgi:hypothetical protein
MSGKDDIYLGDLSLIFILHWNIHSAKRGEPERMLRKHRVTERTAGSSIVFQRVKVPSGGGSSMGIWCSVEFLEPP